MSTVKQIGLLAAGCQPWNVDVCAASSDRFAYCATLAIYIYQYDSEFKEFRLDSIMSEHKKTITAISWNPKDVDLLASASADNQVIIWNVTEQVVVAKLENTRVAPCSVGWCPHEKDCIAFVYGRGPLYVWNYNTSAGLSMHKEAQNFNFDVCQFRWHPKKMGKVAFGHLDGTVSVFCPGQKAKRHVMSPGDEESEPDEQDGVVALEWDPLSTEYLLVANNHSGIRLLDIDNLATITKFQMPSAATTVHTLSWIPSAPGMFATGDTHSGIMRIWTVAKTSPVETFKLKKTGFHALHVFCTSDSLASNGSQSDLLPIKSSSSMSSTSINMSAHKRTSNNLPFTIPPGHALCTFLDGGVGLYDMGKRKWNFLRDQGHIETIFDCKFKPDNPNFIATASFDGTIKVWDINTLEPVHTSPGNEGVIYCLSWAPADLDCVAASTSRNGAFIWDLKKDKIIKRYQEHGKSAVYSIAWNQKDSRKLASCGGDGYCIVRQVDGTVIIKYRHPAPVYGCDWNPNNNDILATGCEDKCVRIFYLATNSDQPLKIFTGHTAKVFQVKWSPLRDGILCSGSDDGTIRIWDYTTDNDSMVLAGHTAPVRGLLWNTEIPYLIMSGSWDYSIRIWDTRDGACLDTVLDHGADVYGLTTHPSRPFTLASCSRDSTVRIWSLTPLIQPLEINIIADRPWTDILQMPEQAMSDGSPPILTGKTSREMKLRIDSLPCEPRLQVLCWFSKFFASPGGVDNLWELVSLLDGQPDSELSPEYNLGIMHYKHLTKFKAAETQHLEMQRLMKQSHSGSLTRQAMEDLQKISHMHLLLGNIHRYCEILIEMGEWDKAIACAPNVSMEYWKSLVDRRAEVLMEEESEEAVTYSITGGNLQETVQYLMMRGQLKEALWVATAAHEGNINIPAVYKSSESLVNGVTNKDFDSRGLLAKTTESLANWYLRAGKPVMAACCHFAVEEKRKGMQKLLRGNELELAVSVGLVVEDVEDLTSIAAELLSRRCEKLGKWDLAVDLLKTACKDPHLALVKLCARCAASMSEINLLHEKAGLPSLEECLQRAEALKSDSNNTMEAVKMYLLSNTPEIGLQIGLKHVKGAMSRSGWQVDEVFPILQLMGAVRTEKFQLHNCAKERNELLTITAYVGALVAVRRKYYSIVPALFKHTKFLLSRQPQDVNLSESLVVSELEAWKAQMTALVGSGDTGVTAEQQGIYRKLLEKAGEERSPVGIGCDVVAGAHLPSHSDVHHSCLTGQRIQGPAFFLEDGRSAISISDALMWSKVNPFSPLGSGVRINPF